MAASYVLRTASLGTSFACQAQSHQPSPSFLSNTVIGLIPNRSLLLTAAIPSKRGLSTLRRSLGTKKVIVSRMEPLFAGDRRDRRFQQEEFQALESCSVSSVTDVLTPLLNSHNLPLNPTVLAQACINAQKAAVLEGHPIWEISFIANTLESCGVSESLAVLFSIEIADVLASGVEETISLPVSVETERAESQVVENTNDVLLFGLGVLALLLATCWCNSMLLSSVVADRIS